MIGAAITGRSEDSRHRYLALDGLRGVAALAVVILHIRVGGGTHRLFDQALLAVDFFFILSGFVLAHAYERGLRSGGAGAYLRDRAIRLYPMILLATLPGAVALLAGYWIVGVSPPAKQWLTALAAIVPFPAPWRGSRIHAQFPINVPLWSLFWEIVVNIGYAIAAPRLSNRVLIGVILIFAAALTFSTLTMPRGPNHLPGLRAFAGFPIGVLLYRIHAAGEHRLARFGPYALPVLLGILMMPSLGRFDSIFHLAAALLVFPLLVLAAADHRVKRERLASFLGGLSYPLYAIHFPLIFAAEALRARGLLPFHPVLIMLGTFAASIAAALLAWRFYDEPIRRRLRAAFGSRAHGGSPASAPGEEG